MICPKCSGESKVMDSRDRNAGETIRRRRRCKTCGYRWSTIEHVVDAASDETQSLRVAIAGIRAILADLDPAPEMGTAATGSDQSHAPHAPVAG